MNIADRIRTKAENPENLTLVDDGTLLVHSPNAVNFMPDHLAKINAALENGVKVISIEERLKNPKYAAKVREHNDAAEEAATTFAERVKASQPPKPTKEELKDARDAKKAQSNAEKEAAKAAKAANRGK
jgi:hypothetical protein